MIRIIAVKINIIDLPPTVVTLIKIKFYCIVENIVVSWLKKLKDGIKRITEHSSDFDSYFII